MFVHSSFVCCLLGFVCLLLVLDLSRLRNVGCGVDVACFCFGFGASCDGTRGCIVTWILTLLPLLSCSEKRVLDL